MFKLIVLSVLVAVTAAKPAESPLLATLVGEKTIESHGNSVVHASAPLVAAEPALLSSPVIAEPAVADAAPAPLIAQAAPSAPILAHAAPASLIKERAIESHGHSVIHASAPLLAAGHPVPLIYTTYPAPATALIGEKTITSYGHSLVHHGGPAIAHTGYIAPAIALF